MLMFDSIYTKKVYTYKKIKFQNIFSDYVLKTISTTLWINK